MLDAIKDDRATRFSIMKRAGINCTQLKKYLQSLSEIGFIEMYIKDGRVLYGTSEKGLDFLRQYYVLLGMLLSLQTRNGLTGVVYDPERSAFGRESHSATQVVTHLQHTP